MTTPLRIAVVYPDLLGTYGDSGNAVILAEAKAMSADLLIKGAYTQSRLRQLVFGGATRHILSHAQIPVLFAR